MKKNISNSGFKVVVVGMGVQGEKRAKIAGKDLLATVDVISRKADYDSLDRLNDNSYNAVLLCTPDDIKYEIIKEILNKKKHILVEKPLFVDKIDKITKLEKLAKKNKVILYTAYNHRFEPHFIKMKSQLDKNELGKIYRVRMFYGNGTGNLVKKSLWRDQGAGVVLDIGSHLIDTLLFWFKNHNISIDNITNFCFENSSPDHAILFGKINKIFFELEVSLLNWKNDFKCDILGEKGSFHIESLCKWGPSKFIKRKRIFPAGRPDEKVTTLIQSDPTWKKEYQHFKKLIKSKAITNLNNDKKIFKILKNIFK